jgi:hypothetical protein
MLGGILCLVDPASSSSSLSLVLSFSILPPADVLPPRHRSSHLQHCQGRAGRSPPHLHHHQQHHPATHLYHIMSPSSSFLSASLTSYSSSLATALAHNSI